MKYLALLIMSLITQSSVARDLYIGTIHLEKNRLILKRCDLTTNTYLLKDAPKEGSAAVKKLAQQLKAKNANYYYGEVVADYEEKKGENILLVFSVENMAPNKSCHLFGEIK